MLEKPNLKIRLEGNRYLAENSVLFNRLVELVESNRFGFCRRLRGKDMAGMRSWIENILPLLKDGRYTLATKCHWIIAGLEDFPKCPAPCAEKTFQSMLARKTARTYRRSGDIGRTVRGSAWSEIRKHTGRGRRQGLNGTETRTGQTGKKRRRRQLKGTATRISQIPKSARGRTSPGTERLSGRIPKRHRAPNVVFHPAGTRRFRKSGEGPVSRRRDSNRRPRIRKIKPGRRKKSGKRARKDTASPGQPCDLKSKRRQNIRVSGNTVCHSYFNLTRRNKNQTRHVLKNTATSISHRLKTLKISLRTTDSEKAGSANSWKAKSEMEHFENLEKKTNASGF